MKILLKLFSESRTTGKWNDTQSREKLFQLLAYAESKSIVIWHAGKNIPFEDSFEDWISNYLTINWGGYGSAVSLDKTYDYFKYQYPGDKVEEKKLKSAVNASKGIFTGVEAFFEGGIDEALIEKFQLQKGTIAKKAGRNTLLKVTKKGKRLISHEPDTFPFFTLNEEMFSSLFPEEKAQKAASIRVKREKKQHAYSDAETEGSIGKDRAKFSSLKKLLASADKDKIDSGLMLLSSLNDAYVSDLLMEGIGCSKSEYGVLEVTGAFKGTLKSQPYHHYAITGILYHAPQNAAYCNQLKSAIKGLSIDIIDPSWLHAFTHLERLELSDTQGQIKSLASLSPSLPIQWLRLKNCMALADISRIADYNIRGFSVSNCLKIKSLQALTGKKEEGGTKELSLKDMEELESLDGIGFYHELESIDLSNCSKLMNAKALLECLHLRKVNTYYLDSCTSIDGLFGSEDNHLRANIDTWSEPQTGSLKIETIDVRCKGMRDLEWLKLFPNAKEVDIDCEDLEDINGLRFVPGLLDLQLDNAKVKSISSISTVTKLERLKLDGCHHIREIDSIAGLEHLDQVHISGCNALEDISGWMRNRNTHHEDELRLYDLQSLKSFGDISHLSNLRTIELNGSFNPQMLPEIASCKGIHQLKINQDEVRIGQTEQLHMTLHIYDAKQLEMKGTQVERLILERCAIKNLSKLSGLKGLKSLTVTDCLSFEALTANTDFPDVEELELNKLRNLKTLKGLESFPKLRRLKISALPSVTDVSPLADMTGLMEIDASDCFNLKVKTKPAGQMTTIQTMDYLLRVAEFYKLDSVKFWKEKAENKQELGPGVPAKEMQKIKKLLQERDAKEITKGIDLVMKANNTALFDTLLQGVTYDGKKIKANKIFSGTGPAQPFLNMAMVGVLSAAAVSQPQWKSFCEKILDLEMELVSMDHLNGFRNLKKIELTNVNFFSARLTLPALESLTIKSWLFSGTGIQEKVSFSQLEDCVKLKTISIEGRIKADNLNGIGKLECLEKLSISAISGLKMKDLSELRTCKKLQKLDIQQGYGTSVKQRNRIDALDGLEQLKDLEHVEFQEAEIKSTAALKGMGWLKEIVIESNDSLVEFIPPSSAEKLERLSLSDCPNLAVIAEAVFPSVLSFNIYKTGFKSFPELKGVTEFSSLNMDHCESLENLDGLSNVKAIEDDNSIALGWCKNLKDLSGISHIKGVRISIGTVGIPNIKVPNEVTSLRASDLKKLDGISNFNKLDQLDISSSSVTDLTMLSEMKTLRILNIKGNDKLKSLKGLETLDLLEELILIDTKNLENISALEALKLKSIHIYGSKKKKADFPKHLQSVIDWQSN